MNRFMLKSKIHHATVTEANVNYIGSITIDKQLMKQANLLEEEQVQVVDVTNGQRLFTYVIEGEENSGKICMNGAAAHLINEGDKVIIMVYTLTEEPLQAKKILVDGDNRFVRFL